MANYLFSTPGIKLNNTWEVNYVPPETPEVKRFTQLHGNWLNYYESSPQLLNDLSNIWLDVVDSRLPLPPFRQRLQSSTTII